MSQRGYTATPVLQHKPANRRFIRVHSYTRGTSRTPRQDSGTQHIAATATGPNPGQGNTTAAITGGRLDYLLQLAKGVPRSAAGVIPDRRSYSGDAGAAGVMPELPELFQRSCSSIKQSDTGTLRLGSTNRVSAVLSREMARSNPED